MADPPHQVHDEQCEGVWFDHPRGPTLSPCNCYSRQTLSEPTTAELDLADKATTVAAVGDRQTAWGDAWSKVMRELDQQGDRSDA